MSVIHARLSFNIIKNDRRRAIERQSALSWSLNCRMGEVKKWKNECELRIFRRINFDMREICKNKGYRKIMLHFFLHRCGFSQHDGLLSALTSSSDTRCDVYRHAITWQRAPAAPSVNVDSSLAKNKVSSGTRSARSHAHTGTQYFFRI